MKAGERHSASGIEGVHHVGFVVAEVETAAEDLCRRFDFRREGPVIHDPVQQVRIQFLQDAAGSSRVELLAPVGPSSPVAAALRQGGGLNHFCYEVPDIDAGIERLRREGAVLVSGPVAAAAISESRVAFLYDRVQGVFELVESPALVTPAEDLSPND